MPGSRCTDCNRLTTQVCTECGESYCGCAGDICANCADEDDYDEDEDLELPDDEDEDDYGRPGRQYDDDDDEDE